MASGHRNEVADGSTFFSGPAPRKAFAMRPTGIVLEGRTAAGTKRVVDPSLGKFIYQKKKQKFPVCFNQRWIS